MNRYPRRYKKEHVQCLYGVYKQIRQLYHKKNLCENKNDKVKNKQNLKVQRTIKKILTKKEIRKMIALILDTILKRSNTMLRKLDVPKKNIITIEKDHDTAEELKSQGLIVIETTLTKFSAIPRKKKFSVVFADTESGPSTCLEITQNFLKNRMFSDKCVYVLNTCTRSGNVSIEFKKKWDMHHKQSLNYKTFLKLLTNLLENDDYYKVELVDQDKTLCHGINNTSGRGAPMRCLYYKITKK